MTNKRFTILKKLENSDIEADVIDSYIEKLVKNNKDVGWVTVGILDNGNPITYKECVELLNEHEELKQKNEIYREYIRAETVAVAEGDVTQVKTDEFIKLCQENDRLSQSNQTKDNYIVEIDNDRRKLLKENEELKKVLGTILIEVRREINYLNRTAEIKVFINPNSYNLIEEVLTEYSSLNRNGETS